MLAEYKQFIKEFPQTQEQKSLAPLTTLKVGGPADLYYEVTNIDELPDLIQAAQKLNIRLFILGGGSNLVFSEKGFRGLIIHMKANSIQAEGDTIIADAGALTSQVLQMALKNNLSGMEKLMGLPGTIGGAVRGNAGAFGVEIKDIFEKALIYNEEKGIHEESAQYFQFRYRSSKIKERKGQDIILRVHLNLRKKDTTEVMKETLEILKNRAGKQPQGKNTGSFFKNPSTDNSAGKLLDEAGCKGLRIGDIQVSDQHANWIMNLGNATQTDIIALMKEMQKRVKEKFNVELEPEVQFVDEEGYLSAKRR